MKCLCEVCEKGDVLKSVEMVLLVFFVGVCVVFVVGIGLLFVWL